MKKTIFGNVGEHLPGDTTPVDYGIHTKSINRLPACFTLHRHVRTFSTGLRKWLEFYKGAYSVRKKPGGLPAFWKRF